jgi:hypothetical protein
MGLVDQEHNFAVPFGLFGGQQVRHLCDRLCLMEPGRCPEGGRDCHIQSAAASRGVGEVDDAVAGAVEPRDSSADGH